MDVFAKRWFPKDGVRRVVSKPLGAKTSRGKNGSNMSGCRNEALPGVLVNRGKKVHLSQGNKGQRLRGTGEQRQY